MSRPHPRKVDAFVRGYIECALWSTDDEDGVSLDANYDLEDIADEETIAKIIEDCNSFRSKANELLLNAGMEDDLAGHNFWLTRNRHGTGFFDRGLGQIGNKLTEISHSFGECSIQVDDDGLIRIM